MPLYPLHKIRALADNRQTYLRGVSGYNAGWVDSFVLTVTPAYSEHAVAGVQESGVHHRVEFGFDHRGRVIGTMCTCGRCRPDGACKHLVAALVYKYYQDMLQESPLPTQTTTAVRAGTRCSDPLARQLIDRYLTAETRRLTARAADSRVLLTPVLCLDGVQPTLSFRVGGEHLYHIKNLSRFARRFAAGEQTEYGKDLTLLHHPDSFAPDSRPLLSFLLAELEERQSLAGVGYAGGVGELVLTPGGFDRFFPLVEGGSLLLHTADGDRPVDAVAGDPTLSVTVEQTGEGVRLLPEQVTTVSGSDGGLYVLRGDTLYRTSASYASRMGGWLQMAGRSPQGLYLAPAELAAFCTGVLPAIRPYIIQEGDTQALDRHMPPPLRAQVSLEAIPTVTARVLFGYGEQVVAPYAPSGQGDICRDPLAELPVKLELERYFAPTPDEEGKLPFLGGDDRLFALLTEGVPALERVAQVSLSADFRALMPSAPPTLHFDVSLVDGLLEMAVEAEDLDPTELAGILAGYRESRPYYRLRDGRFLPLTDGSLADLSDLTQGLGLSARDWQNGRLTLPKYRALYIDSILSRREDGTVARDRLFRDLVERCRQASEKDWPVPSSLEPVLRDYQKTGYRWLCTMEELGFGGILADDMGLGKTIQVITLLLAAKERGEHTPSLVVCPTSVVLGWEREIARFAPALSVLCVMGDATTRHRLLESVNDYDVIITSYDMLKRDVAEYQSLSFHYQVLDEAQYIKNSTTQNARAAKTIRAAQRFALTGTPMENRLSELWSIFDFLMPGLLYSQQKFRARFEQPILRGEDDRLLGRLGRLVSPFILRRLKSQVLSQLPPKTERVLPATMERAQRQVYLDTLSKLRQQLTGVGERRLYGQNRMTVLAQLTRLRQLCCDPRLCCEGYTGGSCKLDACLELLQEAVAGGHKVLLFSQFTSMLALLEQRLRQEGIAYYLLQGSTSKEQRAAMVDAFNSDDTPVFLISLKAGGTGLNLTGADMVIHYDPWWNLAAQNQATDRAHRIGQQKPVQVVRLIARDTIEEKILRMQENKWQLAQSVVEATGPSLTSMTAHELLELLDGE